MKHHIHLLIFASLIGFYNETAFAMPPISLGSGVSIPQLNASNVGSIFTINNGVISQDFTISGDLEIYDLDNLTFSGIIISGGHEIVINESSGLLFDDCYIYDSESFILGDSYITFTATVIHQLDEISLTSESRIDVNGVSSFTDFVNGIFVLD